jgi:putative peptidoglycan lipid II flippase
MQTLAAAAEQAHRSGVALSIDHPSRVRVSIEGDVALAFPATMPEATPEDDIRGIGAALYALLVNRWPLAEAGVRSGLAPAEVDAAGEPVEPRSIDREIPFQISAAAARSVQAGGGIRTAPTLLNLLQQATAVADRTELINPVDESKAPPKPAQVRGKATDDPEAAARRRKGLIVGLSVGGAILVVALIVLASVLKGIFGDVGGFSQDELGLSAPTTSADGDGGGGGATVKPVKATVFSPEGEADAPDAAPLAIDGNTSTVWPIDTYSDPVPFPNFKNGVGLMLQLPQPTTVGEVTIDVNSTGTSVEIRSAQTPTPSSLSDTTVLTPATSLKPGSNTIKVDNASPTSNLLVWVSTLGQVNGESRSDIAEITVKAAS